MSTYDFVLWLVLIGFFFVVWMTKLLINAKSDKIVKFSWTEWQDLSTRAKETLINHGFKPPSPPHAGFDHRRPESGPLSEPRLRGVESLPGVSKPKVFPQGDWSAPENDIRD